MIAFNETSYWHFDLFTWCYYRVNHISFRNNEKKKSNHQGCSTWHIKPSDLAMESFNSDAAGSHCDLISIFSECNTPAIILTRDEEGER